MPVVHCKKSPYDVLITRPGRWGNPFRLGEHESREATIERYRSWLWERIKSGEIPLEDLAALHGKTLACWCKPLPCHGDVLEKAAEWAAAQVKGK